MIGRLAVVLPACAIALVACSAGSDPATPNTGDEFTLPSSDERKLAVPPNGRTVTGTLGFDDIEGGCAYLAADDGTRYEVVYPDGWTIDRAAGALRAADGRVIPAGETVTVHGSVATDRSSVCQIGPIFVATEVEIPAD